MNNQIISKGDTVKMTFNDTVDLGIVIGVRPSSSEDGQFFFFISTVIRDNKTKFTKRQLRQIRKNVPHVVSGDKYANIATWKSTKIEKVEPLNYCI